MLLADFSQPQEEGFSPKCDFSRGCGLQSTNPPALAGGRLVGKGVQLFHNLAPVGENTFAFLNDDKNVA